MKKIINIAASVALLLGVATAAQAQEVDYTAGHNFIGVQAGGQVTLTHYDIADLITPQFGVQFGRYFNDKVGVRLHGMGYQNKGGFKADRFYLTADRAYKFNALTGDLDMLLNMTNIINPNRTSRAFDWVLLAGFGVNYTWDREEYNSAIADMKAYQYDCTDQYRHNRTGFNGRLGTQFNYNFCDAWALGLELQANYKDDVYNLKINDKCDWQVAALLGLTYKFGYKKTAKPEPAPVVEQPRPTPPPAPKPAVRPEPAPKPAPAPVVEKQEPLKETIFFKIRESDADQETILNKVVAWCNKYPNKGITVSGYADKGTGNASINKMYAEKRATKVADAIKAKGVAADRITVQSFGDTVQPFAENDLNRCTIIVGE